MRTKFSFADFMQAALYDKEHGYYASGRANVGKEGDFFTNVSVGKIYGRILTYCFEDIWKKLGQPQSFLLVEQGAHNGQLAHDILETLAEKELSDFSTALEYLIIEPFPAQQKRQKETLETFHQVSWITHEEELPNFEGVHFSNELLDAFPVHIVKWDGSQWQEKCVSYTDRKFSWIIEPITKPELIEASASLPQDLPAGFEVEICLAFQPWLTHISKKMERGVIMIADYGVAGDERFAPHRAEGSIACYQNHQRFKNPLQEPGKQDITAHVDFTRVAEAALKSSFEILGYSDQHHFLIGAAEKWLRSFEEKKISLTPHDQRALQTLLHPESMGRQFKFLGLGKNISGVEPLDGFKYQRPGVRGVKVI